MIKAIIFDCFGVLAGPGFRNIYRYAGGDPQKDWDFIDEMLYLANTASISREEFELRLAEKLDISVDTFIRVTDQYEVPHLDLFDFIRNQLKPRYKLGVLSNANKDTLVRKIPPDLLGLFDYVAESGQIGLIKPQPEAYRFVSDKLGVTTEECLFTDDQERYVSGAREVGMQGIVYSNLEQFMADLASRGLV